MNYQIKFLPCLEMFMQQLCCPNSFQAVHNKAVPSVVAGKLISFHRKNKTDPDNVIIEHYGFNVGDIAFVGSEEDCYQCLADISHEMAQNFIARGCAELVEE